MAARVLVTLPVSRPVAGPELDHVYCACDEDTSLCGLDISSFTYSEDLDDPCIVCDDLLYEPCKECGE